MNAMKIREITDVIERFAPLGWQESYDNAGLVVGRQRRRGAPGPAWPSMSPRRCSTRPKPTGCDLVITHHPLVFHALKRFNSADPVQRCVERAIRSRIALYACHTNLDSAPGGMSWRLAGILGIGNLRLLQPSSRRRRGRIRRCRRTPRSRGTPRVICARSANGSSCGAIRYSDIARPGGAARGPLHRVPGPRSSPTPCRAGAELYITADLKYNDFMTPDKRLMVADVGHFESEYCAIQLII